MRLLSLKTISFFAACLFLPLSVFIIGSYYKPSSPSAPSSNVTSSIPAGSVSLTSSGATINSPIQDMKGMVTSSGLSVTSLSKQGGTFSILPSLLSRSDSTVTAFNEQGQVSEQGNTVLLNQGSLREEFTTSANGITQNFVIPQAPKGTGTLSLLLSTNGLSVSSSSKGITLTLPSGRVLTYNNLSVTDSTGKHLSSSMQAQPGNVIVIKVDDQDASYPITIDPTITDANWVGIGGVYAEGYPAVSAIAYATSTNILYVAGQFTNAGGVIPGDTANNIAEWNGSTWSSLGTGGANGVGGGI